MNTLENIYTFNTRNFEVRVDALEEYCPDFSFDETGETAQMIERGDWICFAVRASISFKGMDIAEDYLGNCIYENIRDFRNDPYLLDMIRNVVCEGRKTINSIPKIKKP
jgi:hypothetical protein